MSTTDYDEKFSECFARFSRPVARYICSRVGDWEAAEELTQDLFFHLYETNRPLDVAVPSTPSFLFASARNRSIDYLRQRLRNLPSKENIEELVPDESFFSRIADTLCDGEVTGTLCESITSLPYMQRSALIMHVCRGKGIRQISRDLGTTEYMVNAAIRCARGTLKESLAKYYPAR